MSYLNKPQTAIEIENDIPLPARKRGKEPEGGPVYKAFEDLKLGQSFFVPYDYASQANVTVRGLQLGCTFTRRTVTENGVKGLRVWRLT